MGRWVYALPLCLGASAGCFPELPACDTECGALETDAGGTTGATTNNPPTDGGSGDPSGSSDGGPSGTGTTDADSSSGSGGDSDGSTTGAPIDACEGDLAPLMVLGENEGVTSERYEVTFPESGAPGSLYDYCGSGNNLLFTNTMHSENNFGVTEFNEWNIWTGPTQITVQDTGPAVVRMVVDWGVNVDGDAEDEAYGTSTYTFIADGRIVREENFTYAEMSADSTLNWMTAYLALDPTRFSQIEMRGDFSVDEDVGLGTAQEIIYSGTPFERLTFCARDSDNHDAIGYTGRNESSAEWNGLRVTESAANGPRSLSFTGDFARGGAGGGGNNNVTPGTYHAYFLTTLGGNPGSDCAAIHDHGDDFTEPAGLNTSGASYYGYHYFTGAHLLGVPSAGTVTVTMPIGDSVPSILFDVADDSGANLLVAGVEVDGTPLEADRQYLVQPGLDDNHWLLIGVPLAEGSTVEISYE